jgi:hypothetical protein
MIPVEVFIGAADLEYVEIALEALEMAVDNEVALEPSEVTVVYDFGEALVAVAVEVASGI